MKKNNDSPSSIIRGDVCIIEEERYEYGLFATQRKRGGCAPPVYSVSVMGEDGGKALCDAGPDPGKALLLYKEIIRCGATPNTLSRLIKKEIY